MERRALLSSGIASGTFIAIAATAPLSVLGAADFAHFKVDGSMLLQAYRSLVEEHLAGTLRSIRIAAATTEAQTGDWALARPLLDRLRADLATAAAVWLVQPDGNYATTERGPTDLNLKDRAYFPQLMAGRDVVGTLVVSKSTGVRSIIVATPILRHGQVIGAIGVSLNARSISQLVIDRVDMHDGMTFYALDQKGQTAIHKDPEKMFQFPSDMGDASLRSAIQIILLQPRGMVTYRFSGTDRKAMFDTSALTGWHFVLVQLAR